MSDMKKRVAITAAVIGEAAVLVAIGILYAVNGSFFWDIAFHVYVKLLLLPIAAMVCKKYLKSQIPKSYKKATVLCALLVFMDLVVVDTVRYIASGGVTTVLFLPFCLPAIFMLIYFYSSIEAGRDIKTEGKLTCIVGVPLLLLSLFVEVVSFW